MTRAPGDLSLPIRAAITDVEIRKVSPVLRQLRPHVSEEQLIERVRRQQAAGYLVAYLEEDGDVLCVAGYRFLENLAWGKFLYVDNLVTDSNKRSMGAGARLLSWLTEEARQQSCHALQLDSGVQRFGAHRFYFREGLEIRSYHFAIDLLAPATDAPRPGGR